MSAPSLLALPGTGVPACCEDETWTPIPDWPHESSTCGRVRSVDRIDANGVLRLGAALPQHPDKGYLYVNLLDGKRHRKVHVAVAVLEAHRGLKPTPGHEACHRYGIPADNHLGGLYWGTKTQNRADRERHREERLVTESVTDNDRRHGQTGRELSREGRFPGRTRSVIGHWSSVTRQGSIDTGRSPSLLNLPSFFISLKPLSSLRTSFRSPRSRRSA